MGLLAFIPPAAPKPNLRIALFYYSQTPDPRRQLLELPCGTKFYVRTEILTVDARMVTLEDALTLSTEEGDEELMNSHYIYR